MAQSSMERKLVFIDLETAGPDPQRHPIIQLAALATDDVFSPLEAYEAKIRFSPHTAKKASLRKSHYHPGTWSIDAKEPKTVAIELAEFCRRHATVPRLSAKGESYHVAQLAAHNAEFDSAFLRKWYDRMGLYLPARLQVVCTMQRALCYFIENRHLQEPRDYKLATLCSYFRVPFHAAAAHDALGDVTATVSLYRAIQMRYAQTAGNSDSRRMKPHNAHSGTLLSSRSIQLSTPAGAGKQRMPSRPAAADG